MSFIVVLLFATLGYSWPQCELTAIIDGDCVEIEREPANGGAEQQFAITKWFLRAKVADDSIKWNFAPFNETDSGRLKDDSKDDHW